MSAEDLKKMFVWNARVLEVLTALVLLISIPFFLKACRAVGDPVMKFWIVALWLCVAGGLIGLRLGVRREEINRKWQGLLLGMLMVAFVSFANILGSLVGFSH